MPQVAYYTDYPHHLVTPALIDELQTLDREKGYDAGLARFNAVVGNDPWFQNPSPSESGYSRLESEYLNIITEEHMVSVPENEAQLA